MFRRQLIFLIENLRFYVTLYVLYNLYVNIHNLCVLDDIANSMKSISESYNDILRINTVVVRYLRNAERREKAINLTTEDIEHTSIRKKQ